MSYASTPPPYENPHYQQQPRRRGIPWVLIVGLVLSALALAACCFGGWSIAQTMQGIANEPVHQSSTTVTLDAGDDRAVWAETAATSCTVDGPSGPVGSKPTEEQNVDWQGTNLYVVHDIPADQGGTYTVSCDGPFRVGDTMPLLATFGIMGAGAVCCLGVLVGAIGLILWLRKR